MEKINMAWKITMGFAVLLSLTMGPATLANTRADTPKDAFVVQYDQLAAKYLTDCDNWDVDSRVSGEKLKRCLTVAKELRDKFDTFLQKLESQITKIKNAKKWTRQLDEAFEKNAAKLGVQSTVISRIKDKGGFRAYYDKSIIQAKPPKTEFAAEIEALEAAIQKSASSHHARSHTTPVPGRRLRNAVRWVREAVDFGFVMAEELAKAI